MARIFKRSRKTKTKDGESVTKKSHRWYITYRDSLGVRRTVRGYADKHATHQFASDLEKQAAQEATGLIDKYAEHRKRPLAEHLRDYKRHLEDKTSPQHVATVIPRVRKILDGCRFTYWTDVAASKVQAFIGDLQRDGLSVQTCNFYLQAMKQFCRWMIQDART